MTETGTRLLRLLFEAPGRDSAWWRFFDALGAAISPDVRAVMLVEVTEPAPSTAIFDGPDQYVAPGLLPRRKDRGPRIEDLPEGSVFDLPRLPREIARHETVSRVLGSAGLRPGPGIGVMLGRNVLGASAVLFVLPRTAGWKPRPEDRALLAELAPFLPRAAGLHERLIGAGAFTALLDHLVLGVILLDERSQVSYANRSAVEILGIDPGDMGIATGAKRAERTEALFRTVARETPEKASYRHPADDRPLQLLETPIVWAHGHSLSARHFRRALFIGDPSQHTGDPIDNLDRMYGLTPAEAKLAWLLVGDLSLADAAAQLGITKQTARTVLKRVLAKTGTQRQASLVRLLLAGPAQVRQRRSTPEPERPSPRKKVRR